MNFSQVATSPSSEVVDFTSGRYRSYPRFYQAAAKAFLPMMRPKKGLHSCTHSKEKVTAEPGGI
jgi:hypothetical protein